ncbi:MAG: iron chaperone [Canibacter sp.]
MPMDKRENPDDYFARLEPHQQAHLNELRRISLAFSDEVNEELRWNTPAYIHNGKSLWMLQAFKNHCSLRFSPEFFELYRAEVKDAGYDSGSGFIKIPYNADIPEALCRKLIRARIDDSDAAS